MADKLTRTQAIAWLVADLSRNGPVSVGAIGSCPFYPPGTKPRKWLMSLPGIKIKRSAKGKRYCEATVCGGDSRGVRTVLYAPEVDWFRDDSDNEDSSGLVSEMDSSEFSAITGQRMRLLHNFVANKFGKNAIALSAISRDFEKESGVKLTAFLGARFRTYSQWPEFKRLFGVDWYGRWVPLEGISHSQSMEELICEVRRMCGRDQVLQSDVPGEQTHDSFVGDKQAGEGESAFLTSFIEDLQACGYDYEPQEIIRFHTSVKCGSFTLLGGAPGRGKSTLAALYARALLGTVRPNKEKVRALTIDVNPAWIEPNDILGYWNLKGSYSCASSGLVPFLRDAKDADEVRLVCLEEMNLARVEHYFSDFIQLLSREPDERTLWGVPSKDGDPQDGASLAVPENVRFIGTNNLDETTQRFSARFYDRCNYIELLPSHRADENIFPRSIPTANRGRFDYGVTFETYKGWMAGNILGKGVSEKVLEKMRSVSEKLAALDLRPSPRVRQGMLEYILNRPFFPGCGSQYSSEADCQLIALDEAIAQRVLPRYSVNYLRDDTAGRRALAEGLRDLPISSALFAKKCNWDEMPFLV